MRKFSSWAIAIILAIVAPIFTVVASAQESRSASSSTTASTSSNQTVVGSVYGHDDGDHNDGEHNNHDDGDKGDHKKVKKYENKYKGIEHALDALTKVLEQQKGDTNSKAIEDIIAQLTAMLKADGTATSDKEAEAAVKEKIETDVTAGTATDESVAVLVTMQVNSNETEAAQANVETALESKPDSDQLYSLLTKVLKEKKDTDNVKVYVKGKKPVFDAAPYQKGDRNMVPVRAISEALGAKVDWNQDKQTVTIVKDGITIEFPIGSTSIKVNGQSKTIDATSERSGDRTFVPIRFISEFLGQQVSWDQDTKTVIVK